ncbi:MAG TPA: aldose 1-epimerase family protein [Lacisediminihabitans sp.]|uniref:aldose 1-epimerase family protein n=1 Tax=Lacisediminihabitans sp. TaxID=2787631 RepID=UPI002EDA0228
MALSELDNGILSVSVDSNGAQLNGLVDQTGRQLLWQGSDVWRGQAPVLFPIVGRMPGNQLIHAGTAYPIAQHGFARNQEFEVERISGTKCRFVLTDNDQTHAHFPFGFRFELLFTVEANRLTIVHTVSNTGPERFSASLGAHPGFAWPLAPGVAREDHVLEFAAEEPAPIRRIADGLLLAETRPTPVQGRILQLDDSLFVDDAIIFDELTSRSVRYSAPGAASITVAFADFPLLGVWSRAPGEFLCIEPWFGMTAPDDFAGEYNTKPGQFSLDPGQSRTFSYSITVDQP